jgi:uncharacterized protein YegP (UPF0339 family)
MIKFIKNLFSSPKYRIHRSKNNNNFYFVLVAKNGEIILNSEGYLTKDGALNGIRSVSENGIDIFNFEVKKSKNGKFYFVLKANNNKIIGTSEIYDQMESAYVGIQSVRSCCGTSIIKFDGEEKG